MEQNELVDAFYDDWEHLTGPKDVSDVDGGETLREVTSLWGITVAQQRQTKSIAWNRENKGSGMDLN